AQEDEVTKFEGQPTEVDLNQLTKEFNNAAGSVATQNRGRGHAHVGMVVKEAEYVTFSKEMPRAYPTTVDVSNVVIREHQIAKHKAKTVAYETYLGVKNWLRRMIVKTIDHKWLAKLESETMDYNHLAPKD
ncbi:hypothetical protein ACHAW6_007254, partial [Cyclotella cf. meneghiniana]